MKYNKNDEQFYIDFFQNLDYIVIGSGSGGCTVSKILTDDNNIKVFMIEDCYDQDDNRLIKQSYNSPSLEMSYYPNFFGFVRQVTQKNLSILEGNYTNCGGSAINSEQYVKGTNYYYNKISEELKDDDWSWVNVKNTFDEFFDEEEIINTRNPSIPENKASRKIVNAMVNSLNVEEIEDYNSFEKDYTKNNGAFTNWKYYQNKDITCCSSSTFILKKDLYMKDNFIIIDKSTVVKILFKDNKAIGVIYYRNGESKEVFCKKCVILSA
jgi:choline dehydrogenase-like flavoprotein